jgi:hypothetical protein
MTDWRESRTYCNGCGRWRGNIQHKNCRRGERGSLIWVDLDNYREACNQCNESWALEDSVMICGCGHRQRTEYVDSIDVVQAGERIIATEGNTVYVLTRTGTVVVGRRAFPGTSYK